jgi:hypothetical protein
MQKTAAVLLALLFIPGGAPASALDGVPAKYASGTVDAFQPETNGTLDTVPPEALGFRAAQSQFTIPYMQVTSFHFHEESKLHVGVLAMIVVALFAPWQKVDRVTIVWDGVHGNTQVATLVLSKQDGQGLISILEARAHRACGSGLSQTCGQEW